MANESALSSHLVSGQTEGQEATLDLRDLLRRVGRGLPQTIGLAFIGAAVGAIVCLILGALQPTVTSTRVTFSFQGFDRGQYPDQSKFQPDDLRASAIVGEALRRLNLDANGDLQGKIRAAISIEGIIPPGLAKERDRIRASGQTLAPYVADEYLVSLTWPRNAAPNPPTRARIIMEMLNVYRETFQRTYAKPPLAIGTAFASLRNADYPEYEIILRKEVERIIDYLSLQLDGAKSFRSSSTNLSFKDLIDQTQLFEQTRLNETLGLIRENGLSRNRRMAMVKMNYYVRTLEDQERRAVEEEQVVRQLLDQSQNRFQSYVLGIKSQAEQPRNSPLVDQGLIESLIQNDAYNFLVRRDLEAGLRVKQVQSEKAQVIAARENMNSFIKSAAADQSDLISQVQVSIEQMKAAYDQLTESVIRTQADFARQQYADSVRLSDRVITTTIWKTLATLTALGLFVGLSLGVGLSLLEIYWERTGQAT